MVGIVRLLRDRSVRSLDDQTGNHLRHGRFVNDLTGDLLAVFIHDLRLIMHDTVYALDQHDLLPCFQLGVLKIIGLVGDRLFIFLNLDLFMYDLHDHAVIGQRFTLTGENVIRAERDIEPAQQRCNRFAIGTDDAPLSPMDDGHHLHPLDVNASDTVIIGRGVGILLAQLDPHLVQNDVRIRAVRFVNRYMITVRDHIAVLRKNSLRQQSRQRGNHHGDGKQSVQPISAMLFLFFRSVHQSILLSVVVGFTDETIVTLL